MKTQTTPIITIERLSKVYIDGAEIRALDEVSMTVERGEFVAVMGPSGSGKSTLLNLIGTLDEPTFGKVLVDGVDIGTLTGNAMADFRRANIGFVFQLFNLVPTLSVLENVMLPLIPYQRGLSFKLQDRARELLESVGLGHRLNHLPGQLSGGEQQRVAIARALVNKPSIILADEPTGNVDTRTGDEVMELIEKVRRDREQTVMVATHNPRVAACADRVYFLKDGAIVDESRLGGERSPEILWSRIGIG